jgi:hypothetical protein
VLVSREEAWGTLNSREGDKQGLLKLSCIWYALAFSSATPKSSRKCYLDAKTQAKFPAMSF